MKKIGICSIILTACLISPNILAEWIIPGAHCVSVSRDYKATYDYGAVTNMTVRPNKDSPTYLQVACSSPIHTSYGNNLDMDFFVDMESGDQILSCQGYVLDDQGRIIQDTKIAQVAAGISQVNVKLTASGGNKYNYNNGKPATILALCSIPDHGYRNCGTCPPRWSPSRLDSIRVY